MTEAAPRWSPEAQAALDAAGPSNEAKPVDAPGLVPSPTRDLSTFTDEEIAREYGWRVLKRMGGASQ